MPKKWNEPGQIKALNDFIAKVGAGGQTTKGMARAERFQVDINATKLGFGNLEDEVRLYAEEVQIPGMVLTNKEFNIGPWQFFRNTSMGFLGNEINITFLTDNDWQLRSFFELWMAKCVDTTSKKIGYIDDVSTDITITTLAEDNIGVSAGVNPHAAPSNYSKYGAGEEVGEFVGPTLKDNTGDTNPYTREAVITKQWKLYECMPKVLNLVPLSMGTTSVIRTTLIISAAYWESSDVPGVKGTYVGLKDGDKNSVFK
jgi:hypothetical protein